MLNLCAYSLTVYGTYTYYCLCFFFQAEDGIRYLVRSRGLGDVYKRQGHGRVRRLAGPEQVFDHLLLGEADVGRNAVVTHLSLIHI